MRVLILPFVVDSSTDCPFEGRPGDPFELPNPPPLGTLMPGVRVVMPMPDCGPAVVAGTLLSVAADGEWTAHVTVRARRLEVVP